MRVLGILYEACEWFPMKIREFSIEEFAALSQLWRRSGFETRPGDSKEELRRKLKRDSDLFLVAEADSKIVGSVMGAWDGRRGWIYHLASTLDSAESTSRGRCSWKSNAE